MENDVAAEYKMEVAAILDFEKLLLLLDRHLPKLIGILA